MCFIYSRLRSENLTKLGCLDSLQSESSCSDGFCMNVIAFGTLDVSVKKISLPPFLLMDGECLVSAFIYMISR